MSCRFQFFSAFLCLAVSATAQGAVIAQWDLNSDFAASNVDGDIQTASDLTDVGINSLGFDGIGWEFDGLPDSPAKTDYATVTLTADSGFQIDLNGGSVTFNADYISGNRDADGYTVDVISDPGGTAVTQTLGTSDDGEVNFNSGSITGFTVANEIELRVYWNNGQTWGDQQMGDLVINGEVIPEPASFALLGLGSLLMAGGRRRRG
jgi:hypothetical protein